MPSAAQFDVSSRRTSSISSNNTEQSYQYIYESHEEPDDDLAEKVSLAPYYPAWNSIIDTKDDYIRSKFENESPMTLTAPVMYRRSYQMPNTSSSQKHSNPIPSQGQLKFQQMCQSARGRSKSSGLPSQNISDKISRNVTTRKAAIDKAHSGETDSVKTSSTLVLWKACPKNNSSPLRLSTKYPDHPSNNQPRTLMEAHCQLKSDHTERFPKPGEGLFDVSANEDSDNSGKCITNTRSIGRSPSLSEFWRSPSPRTSRRPTIVAGGVVPFSQKSAASYRGLGRRSFSGQESTPVAVQRRRLLKQPPSKKRSQSPYLPSSIDLDKNWDNDSILPNWGLDPYPPINRSDNPFRIYRRSSTESHDEPTIDIPRPFFRALSLPSHNLAFLGSPYVETASNVYNPSSITIGDLGRCRRNPNTSCSSALVFPYTTPTLPNSQPSSRNIAFLDSPYIRNSATTIKGVKQTQKSSKSPSKALNALVRKASRSSSGSVADVLKPTRTASRLRSDASYTLNPSQCTSKRYRDYSMHGNSRNLASFSSVTNDNNAISHGLGISLRSSEDSNATIIVSDNVDIINSRSASSLSRRSSLKRITHRRVLNKDENETSGEDETPVMSPRSSLSKASSSKKKQDVLKADDTDMEGETSEDDEGEYSWEYPLTSPTTGELQNWDLDFQFSDEEEEELSFDEQYDFEDAFEPRPKKDLSQETHALLYRLENNPIIGCTFQGYHRDEGEPQDDIQYDSQSDSQKSFQDYLRGDDLQGQDQLQEHFQTDFRNDFEENVHGLVHDDIQDDRAYAQQLLGFSTAQMIRMMRHNGPATLDDILEVAREPGFRKRMELDAQGN